MKVMAISVLLIVCAAETVMAQSRTVIKDYFSYERWLHEDTAYIITDQEAAQYKLLKSNDDRDRFITEFWLRRDPTPGTVENQYKEEHYRRIAYSNEHFADKLAGWKTDRGRIYIVYGPPDKVERHSASGTNTAFGHEEYWHYDLIINGEMRDFTFVDSCNCGEYRLKRAPVR
jgi:GWxTD domain-containing protein